jgi:SpoVK/Ycf46/Vps4 family AAA+-type ATPase
VASKHIKQMIAAYRDGDDLAFRRAAMALIEEEEAKRHPALARELRQLLSASGGHPVSIDMAPIPSPPVDPEHDMPLADISSPRRYLRDLVLAPPVVQQLEVLLDETNRWAEIDAAGLPRRQRVLLHGPQGCGKTSIVEAVAGDLGRLLVLVRVDAVMSSYLGETATNLRRLFEFAASGPYVIFFDEFDALGKERSDPADHGELRRVVNAFLQLLDRYSGPSLIVAATNHESVLDYALWRRFDEVIEVPRPTLEETVQLLRTTLRSSLDDWTIRRAAEQLVGLPHAAAERVGLDALRTALLQRTPRISEAQLQEAVDRALARPWT